MGENEAIRRKTRRRWVRALGFFLLAASILCGTYLYWYLFHIPSEILTAVRAGKADDVEAGTADVPSVIRNHFHRAVPDLLDALYVEDEQAAAFAFLVLRKKGVEGGALRRRFRPDEKGEGPLRAALLLEWEEAPGEPETLGFPDAFLARYLRWKATLRSGPFALSMDHRLEAFRALLRHPTADGVGFLLETLEDPAVPASQKSAMAVLIAHQPAVKKAFDILVKQGVRVEMLLRALKRHKAPWKTGIMKRALCMKDPMTVQQALDYFILHPDEGGGEALKAFFASPRTDIDARVDIAVSYLSRGFSWTPGWIQEGIARWPEAEVVYVLGQIGDARARIRLASVEPLLVWAASRGGGRIPSAALRAWVELEGRPGAPTFGWGRFRPGPNLSETFEIPRQPLVDKTYAFRRRWTHAVRTAFRIFEATGRVTAKKDLMEEAAGVMAAYLDGHPPEMERDPTLRRRMAGFLGALLERHGSVLDDRGRIEATLLGIVRRKAETERTRLEAAFHLALGGVVEADVVAALAGGMRTGPPSLRYACAAALGHLEGRGTSRQGSRDARALLFEALEGRDPLAFYLAARETPNVPAGWMSQTARRIATRRRTADAPVRTVADVADAALRFLVCDALGSASPAAAWLAKDEIPGGLTTVWAERAGIPPDPSGGPDVLRRLAGVLETTGNPLERLRAASLLLRLWTGRRFGFDPMLGTRHHAAEIAKRWKAWLAETGERLAWDPAAGRFRVR